MNEARFCTQCVNMGPVEDWCCTCAAVWASPIKPGPHDCPHWAPSDAHRTAEALEVIAGCLVEQSIADEEARIPPEVQAFRCNCRSVVECMSTDTLTKCSTCGQFWQRSESEPDEWNEFGIGDLT